MRQLLSILFLTVLIFTTNAQRDYTTIDSISKYSPQSISEYNEIALYLTKDLTDERDKARALYVWVAHNISYDFDIDVENFRYKYEGQMVDEAIEKRKGVCQHYADLYDAMAKAIGLETYVISGYVREYTGKISGSSHAWNLIKISSSYYFLDVTWASSRLINGGYSDRFSDQFFLVSPKVFILDHMPFDPIWQCLSLPLTHQNFMDKNYSRLEKVGDYRYDRFIYEYQMFSPLEQLESSNQRIKANGITNQVIKNKIIDNESLIINIKYNEAVEILNDAIYQYNSYISSKNEQFLSPKLSDEQIQMMIEEASYGIYTAQSMFKTLKTHDKELKKSISGALKLVKEVIPQLEREKKFVEQYTHTKKVSRIYLF